MPSMGVRESRLSVLFALEDSPQACKGHRAPMDGYHTIKRSVRESN